MDEVEFANLIANLSSGPVEFGLLSPELADAIHVASDRRVVLSGYTYDKERFTHPDIVFDDFSLITIAMRDGYAVISDHNRNRSLVIGYKAEQREGKCYKLVLKATKDDTGIQIETFHRIDKSEFGRLLRQASKRGLIVRNPYPELERRQTK